EALARRCVAHRPLRWTVRVDLAALLAVMVVALEAGTAVARDHALDAVPRGDVANGGCDPTIIVCDAVGAHAERRVAKRVVRTVGLRQTLDARAGHRVAEVGIVRCTVAVHFARELARVALREAGLSGPAVGGGAALLAAAV